MAAIDLHIGTQYKDDRDATLTCEVGSDQPVGDGHALDGARACLPSLSATHNGLTRMVWIRRTLEDLIAGRKVGIVDGETLGITGAAGRTKLYFTIDPPYLKDEIPWMPAATTELAHTALIGESGKMACPTWDLPAGSPIIGGSCPGATAGQSVIPLGVRAPKAGTLPVRIQETICQICYAEGGQYASPHVQLGELVRYWWCRSMLDAGDATTRAEWVATVVRAIQGEIFPEERPIDPRTGKAVLPMRIHSSGDFYSAKYADAWIDVCNALPEVMFWAPTRTWAAPGWMDTWRRILPRLAHKNLSLRPSAYHTGDAAPSEADHPWPGGYDQTSAGTTAIYKFDDGGEGTDQRYDWACRTYAILDDAHSCQNAVAPDGKTGCRACWLHPELRVNYTAH